MTIKVCTRFPAPATRRGRIMRAIEPSLDSIMDQLVKKACSGEIEAIRICLDFWSGKGMSPKD